MKVEKCLGSLVVLLKQKRTYEIRLGLVGWEVCIRESMSVGERQSLCVVRIGGVERQSLCVVRMGGGERQSLCVVRMGGGERQSLCVVRMGGGERQSLCAVRTVGAEKHM